MRKKTQAIYLNVKYKKNKLKTKLGGVQLTEYKLNMYGNDDKKYYSVKLAGDKFLPILLDAYISKYGPVEGRRLFEEFLDILNDIGKKGLSPFKLFITKYNPNLNLNNNENE